MTKDELVKWLTYVSVKGDVADKRALVMLTMTPLRQGTPIAAGERLVERIHLRIDDGTAVRFAELSVKYIIEDPSVIEVAWRKAFAGRLQLEPSTKIECDDATVADGVIALLSERPVLTIVAFDSDSLEMRIGAKRSRIYHPGNLMDISRQMVETDRDT